METTKEEAPCESLCTSAVCSKCGCTMFKEEIVTTTIQNKKAMYRKVTGSYIQFLDEDGLSIGPFWPVCEACQTNPLDSLQVQENYLKLTNSKGS
jgi:hypothetical protein